MPSSPVGWCSFLLVVGSVVAQHSWYERTPLMSPSARNAPTIVFDPVRSRCVLMGGGSGMSMLDTWLWDGAEWAATNPATRPSARQWHAAVWDSGRNRAVVFGGNGPAGMLDDVWEWDGTNWSAPQPWNRPAARMVHAMSYDPWQGVTVLFGGVPNGPGLLGDTWIWDGQQWWQVASSGPTARAGMAMAFDPVNSDTVLFGGNDANGTPNDETWRWNGVAWSQVTVATRPSARHSHRMVFDADRGRIVLFGGETGFLALTDQVWSWDGSNWAQDVFPPQFWLRRAGAGLAYDAARRRLVMFGGSNGFQDLGDTWEYVADTAANYETFGQGCPSPAGVPWMTSQGGSLPWAGSTFTASLVQVSTDPAHALLGIIGDSATNWGGVFLPFDLGAFGMPGCALRTNPYATVVLTNLGGRATWSIAIPTTPVLVGNSFFLQGAAPSLGANAGGLVFSNGCEIRIG